MSANTAFDGGGLYVQSSTAALMYCEFSANIVEQSGGGGGLSIAESNATLTYCYVLMNMAEYGYGGGLCVQELSVINMTNCTVSSNVAYMDCCGGEYAGAGGGLFVQSATAILTSCTMLANVCICWWRWTLHREIKCHANRLR